MSIYIEVAETSTNVAVTNSVTTVVSASTGLGVSDFLALTDTPSSFSGQGGKIVSVNVGETALEFSAAGSGSGDVVGPASSTDNAIARFDSTTGKLLQDSVVTIDDTTGVIKGAKEFWFDSAGNYKIVYNSTAGTLELYAGGVKVQEW